VTALLVALFAAVCLAICLMVPDVASARTLSMHKARSVALEAGRKIARQTGAYKTQLSGCRRRGSHRINCTVENVYRSGSQNCSTDIEIRFASRSSSRVVWTARRTLCF
jgi:hypothetical protein